MDLNNLNDNEKKYFKSIIINTIILVILISLYVYIIYDNVFANHCYNSITSMNSQQIDAFNNQFENYKGKQEGSNVAPLIGRLIANANTYKNEPSKIPEVVCDEINSTDNTSVHITYSPDLENTTEDTEDDIEPSHKKFIDGLLLIKNNIEKDHTYTITFSHDSMGLISKINIKY